MLRKTKQETMKVRFVSPVFNDQLQRLLLNLVYNLQAYLKNTEEVYNIMIYKEASIKCAKKHGTKKNRSICGL